MDTAIHLGWLCAIHSPEQTTTKKHLGDGDPVAGLAFLRPLARVRDPPGAADQEGEVKVEERTAERQQVKHRNNSIHNRKKN